MSTSVTSVAASVVLAGIAIPAVYAASAAPSTSAVIAEVYGGGGNSGATLTHDFVELANASGSAAYDLAGHSVQYLPGTPSATSKWSVTALAGSLAPGGRHLVQEAAGSGGTTVLPAPDTTGSIAMGGSSGTVALVSGTDPLTCRTAADCASDSRVVDLVGYGSAVVREGIGPASGTSNTASVSRAASLADIDDNAADFTAGSPSPVNAAGQTPGGGTPSPTPTPMPTPTEPGPVRIHDVQGTTRVSPLKGETVTRVPGIVTGVRTSGSKGYWIQDPDADADPATSEGLFVYTGSATPTVKTGDSVLVTGKVAEHYPSSTNNQSVTQITGPTATVLSSGNALPAPVVLDAASVPDAYTPTADGGSIEGLTLAPKTYALDFYESLEGARVTVRDTRVVGATTEHDELWVTTKSQENPTPRGGTVYGSYDRPNTGRIKVMSLDAAAAFPQADVGDQLSGVTEGPLDYSTYGGYNLQATTLGTLVDNNLRREVTRKQRKRELAIATYNVENLDALDPQEKFDRLAEGVAVNLAGPDIVMLEEIQDDNGATNDGTVTAEATLNRFTDAVVAAGGPRYSWRYVSPENGKDGGEPGGNIRQVFLFNDERVDFMGRGTDPAGPTTATQVVKEKHGAKLTYSPGRINPVSDAWANSRKPLVGEFKFRGDKVFVIGNHFNSKGGDQPLHGRNQEPTRSSEAQRHLQAAEVNTFVKSLLAADKDAQIVVLGDLNDFEFSTTTDILTGGGTVLTPLITKLPAAERYSYVYDGNSQTLDHILTSRAIRRVELDVVHINAEFADQASDHDPQIIRWDVKSSK
jgi:predicted extracellular nuclease